MPLVSVLSVHKYPNAPLYPDEHILKYAYLLLHEYTVHTCTRAFPFNMYAQRCIHIRSKYVHALSCTGVPHTHTYTPSTDLE